MYTWEQPFQKKVTDIRNEEIKRLKTTSLYSAINLLSANHGPFIVCTYLYSYIYLFMCTLNSIPSCFHYVEVQYYLSVVYKYMLLMEKINYLPICFFSRYFNDA